MRSFYGNQRMQKWPKIVYLFPIVSFGCNPTEAFKSHPEKWEAYFIKWTTSVEPAVGSKVPKTQNEVTVDPYIISSFYRDPVYSRKMYFYIFNYSCLHHWTNYPEVIQLRLSTELLLACCWTSISKPIGPWICSSLILLS